MPWRSTRSPRCREPPSGLIVVGPVVGAWLIALAALRFAPGEDWRLDFGAAPPGALPPRAAVSLVARAESTALSLRTNLASTIPSAGSRYLRSKRTTVRVVAGPNTPTEGVGKPARVRSVRNARRCLWPTARSGRP